MLLSHQWLSSPKSHIAAALGRKKCAVLLLHVLVECAAAVVNDCPVALQTSAQRKVAHGLVSLPRYPLAWWGCR